MALEKSFKVLPPFSTARANTVLIAAFVLFALIFAIWFTSPFTSTTTAVTNGAPSGDKPTYAANIQADGGIFVILHDHHHKDCTSYVSRSTNPIAAISALDSSECISISLGLVFHSGRLSETAAKKLVPTSKAQIAKWASSVAFCGDMTLLSLHHGIGGPMVMLQSATARQRYSCKASTTGEKSIVMPELCCEDDPEEETA